jgi:chromosome segregation ATPase
MDTGEVRRKNAKLRLRLARRDLRIVNLEDEINRLRKVINDRTETVSEVRQLKHDVADALRRMQQAQAEARQQAVFEKRIRMVLAHRQLSSLADIATDPFAWLEECDANAVPADQR